MVARKLTYLTSARDVAHKIQQMMLQDQMEREYGSVEEAMKYCQEERYLVDPKE